MTDTEIRPVTDADIAGVVALIEDRIGAEDAPEAQLVLEDRDFDRRRWSVAVDGHRVVSTMATFPMEMRIGVAGVPAAQIEFVATHRDHEGRGLVRRQFDYHHHDLAARGELFQVIVGITYFYRRLGYEYALEVADWRTIPVAAIPSPPDGWTVREATLTDLPAIARLQIPIQDGATVAVGFSPELWSYVLRSPVYQTLLAEHGGAAAACGRLYRHDGEPYLMDLAAADRAGVDAILADVGRRVAHQPLQVMDRDGLQPVLGALGTPASPGDAYYARVGNPVAFLNSVRPELTRRLAASALATEAGSGLISLYSSSIRFDYADGAVGQFSTGGTEQAPVSKGGSGVAPDQFVSLLVGHRGFAGLEELHPDVMGGAQRELMHVLFPPQTADVQSWVVP